MQISIPYHKGHMHLDMPDERLIAVLKSTAGDHVLDVPQDELVKRALASPVNSSPLSVVAKNRKKVLLITSDHTRPVPSRITLPLLLDEIRKGSPEATIKVLIATGFHRADTPDETRARFGDEVFDREEIYNHDSRDEAAMEYFGTLPSGGALWLNKLVNWADLVVSEGFIEPHFFAGFSGGRKSVLPGIASAKTVFSNHCARFISDPAARTGSIDGNPIQADMVYAAEAARLEFILNVAIDQNKRIVRAFAGHPATAHKEGCAYVRSMCVVKSVTADIVITSNGGWPLDRNIYQAVKGMTAAEACVRPGGVIIMTAACADGHGGEDFFRWLKDAVSPRETAERISHIPQNETQPDQWEAQILARVLLKATIILVTDMCDKSIVEAMHMKHSNSLEEAFIMASEITGPGSSVVVIPDGVGIIPE